MNTQNQAAFKEVLKEYMRKHNIKANDAFLESADASNIRTRKAAE